MKKITLTVPTELKDIKLKKFMELDKLPNKDSDEAIVSSILGLSINELGMIPSKSYKHAANDIKKLFEQEDKPFVPRFKIGEVEFGFIPNLDKITYGENKMITTTMNDVESYDRMMAVLYRPITEEYKGKYLIEPFEDTKKYQEIMREAPLDVVLGAVVFFWNLSKELDVNILKYLNQENKPRSVVNGHRILRLKNFLIRVFQRS